MNRLYAVESMPTSTGARADHRLPLQAERDRNASRAQIAGGSRRSARCRRRADGRPGQRVQKWIAAVAKDLQAHRGASLVIAGDGQPPASTRSRTR